MTSRESPSTGFEVLFDFLYGQRLFSSRCMLTGAALLAVGILLAGDALRPVYHPLVLKIALSEFAISFWAGLYSVLGTSLRTALKRERLLLAAVRYDLEITELLEPHRSPRKGCAERAFLSLQGALAFRLQLGTFLAGGTLLIVSYLAR